METGVCPKCGSDKVVNDQCLKCGIVISKYVKSSQSASGAVSFVASHEQSPLEYSYSLSKEALDYEAKRKRIKNQTRLIGAVILLVVGGLSYLIYRGLTQQASAFGGMYKNHELVFGLHFPESGAKWFHLEAGNLEEFGLEDPDDAFYRGEDRGNPDAVIAIFLRTINPASENMSAAQKEKLLRETEDDLLNRMAAAGVECEIVDSEFIRPGGRDGFIIEAEIEKGEGHYRAFVMGAFLLNRGYTLYILGPDEKIIENEDEIRRLIESFSFKTSAI